MRTRPSSRLLVREVIEETADARSLILAVPPGEEERYSFRPGQFLTLRVPHVDGDLGRCYSISSSPYTGEPLKVTVKRVQEGRGSNWLCDHVAAGTELEVLPPAGGFTPSSLDVDLLLFAAGSGVTPLMSILKSALTRRGKVTMLYANRDETSVIFRDELRSLALQHPERLRVVHWLESVQGIPTAEQLQAWARGYDAHEAFVCGPEPFMAAAEVALARLGMPRSNVFVERFRSLSDDPFAPTTTSSDVGAPADAAAVRVDLDGQTHSFAWPRDKTLLDLLLDGCIDAPYSCREGACGACACRVVNGEVKMLRNEVLEAEDLAAGHVLACQAVPISDDVTVAYD